jgi:hypothetical protein
MPLTNFQKKIALVLSANRTEDSHLAGGAALHFQPNSLRFSEDLDYFHDSEERVASAFAEDSKLLKEKGYNCKVELSLPGYIRALVNDKTSTTKVEWAFDSAWRFMPVQKDSQVGFILHPIDLVINKLLALVGRDEPRDFLDVLHTHQNTLPLGAQIWAACGKDPGLSPDSILELLKRRGRYQPQDFARLHLKQKVDLGQLKSIWMEALSQAQDFISQAPLDELGCLYYSKKKKDFVQPQWGQKKPGDIVCHYGRPGGVYPLVKES